MINKFFYIKGGSETYYFSLKRLLEEHGHQVIDFSMADDKNFDSPYGKYFVKNVEYNGHTSIKDKLSMASHIIYSREAQKNLEQLIIDTRPDIAHLHIFQHQMSPSILSTLEKHHIPVVYTAHDLKMLCLNYKMLNHTGICEKCKGHKYYNCVKYKCIKDSMAKSAICMVEGYLHRMLKSYDKIDCIITPSKFYYDKFLEFGISADRVRYIPNFLEDEKDGIKRQDAIDEKITDRGAGRNNADATSYFLYLGRISEEKGIGTLMKAVKGTKHQVKIAGTGPLFDYYQQMAREEQIPNVEFLGFQQGVALQNLVRDARAVILPSEWYENSPYSGIEAISQGKVMIGSDLGGIPELIRDGENGYIFPAGMVSSLRSMLDKVMKLNDKELSEMKQASYQLFQERFTAEKHYTQILEVYGRVCREF
ncbi:MAG: glycosyltransferase family 4 protein [Lachnospiraceae bacterium]|nr:glycosyltransferase family 4 protein [Lachnospiraceae bacterium]